jgi:peptidoglycan hydrolase-like protein with peptidoglycan-binding domain
MDDEFSRWDTETESEVRRPVRRLIRPSTLRRRPQPSVGRPRTPTRKVPPQPGRLRSTWPRPIFSSRPVRPIAWPVYPAVMYPPSAPFSGEPGSSAATGQGEPAIRTEYVRWVQSCLNQAEGLGLSINGVMDAPTRSAVRSFQKKHDLPVDGIVGPPTETALAAACRRSGEPATNNGAATTPTSSITGPPSTEPEPEEEAEWERSLLAVGAAPRSSVTVPQRRPALQAIDTLLPATGPGYYVYGLQERKYGLAQTIRAVQAIGAAWLRAYPSGPLVGVGNISLRGGGPIPPHVTHQVGVDVDFRPVRSDGQQYPVTYHDLAYSRQLTQKLVELIRANGILPVRSILFNDTALSGVKYWKGHDNHLHVHFVGP